MKGKTETLLNFETFAAWKWETGLSRPYVTRIASGERPVTESVKDAVKAGLLAEERRLREQALGVRELFTKYVMRK
jgi:hypothetical protein